ncbi:MAG TPA: S-methyl-5'-thioadenosine phosphorylase, partial [Acidobacteriota bacterium]|nr:S-methyl-5'-thioadenosine phosphorylase [Acidobacteriota bacterium]
AREAGVGYATLAMVCDYDCWHEEHADVTAEIALANLRKSVESAQRVIRGAIDLLPADAPSSCEGEVARAIMTSLEDLSASQRRRLALLLELETGERS